MCNLFHSNWSRWSLKNIFFQDLKKWAGNPLNKQINFECLMVKNLNHDSGMNSFLYILLIDKKKNFNMTEKVCGR